MLGTLSPAAAGMREEWTALCWDALNEYFTNLVAVPQVAMSDGLLGFLDTTQKY